MKKYHLMYQESYDYEGLGELCLAGSYDGVIDVTIAAMEIDIKATDPLFYIMTGDGKLYCGAMTDRLYPVGGKTPTGRPRRKGKKFMRWQEIGIADD